MENKKRDKICLNKYVKHKDIFIYEYDEDNDPVYKCGRCQEILRINNKYSITEKEANSEKYKNSIFYAANPKHIKKLMKRYGCKIQTFKEWHKAISKKIEQKNKKCDIWE